MNRIAEVVLVLMVAVALCSCASHEAQPAKPVADVAQAHLVDVARGAFENAEYENAAKLYELARERARLRDDVPAIAAAAFNLAAARLRLGELDAAHAAIDEALAALVDTPAESKLDVLLLSAELSYRRGDSDGALAVIAPALAAASAAPRSAAQLRLLAGQIACDRRDAAAAHGALDATLANADLAAHARLEGSVAMLDGDAKAAGLAFDREATAQRERRDYRAMAEALGHAGDAYAQGGDTHTAADRLLRAGRSAAGQGALERARRWLSGAQELAAASGDNIVHAAASADLRELEQLGDAR